MIATDTERLEFILSEILLNEWEAQGHSMSGKAVKDIKYEVKQETNRIILSGFMYPYANIQAAGVKSGKIPFAGTAKPGQGSGGTSKYIQGLMLFVRARMGITNDKECLGIAFAIAKTQKKEGMPTQGSYKFTSTGKRTDWVEEAFRKNEDRITKAISDMSFNQLSVNLDVLLNKWQILLNEK